MYIFYSIHNYSLGKKIEMLQIHLCERRVAESQGRRHAGGPGLKEFGEAGGQRMTDPWVSQKMMFFFDVKRLLEGIRENRLAIGNAFGLLRWIYHLGDLIARIIA